MRLNHSSFNSSNIHHLVVGYFQQHWRVAMRKNILLGSYFHLKRHLKKFEIVWFSKKQQFCTGYLRIAHVRRGQNIPSICRKFSMNNGSTFIFFIPNYKSWITFKSLWTAQMSNLGRSVFGKSNLTYFKVHVANYREARLSDFWGQSYFKMIHLSTTSTWILDLD